jgi:23S rRNA pseudouridine1911/1915/1917 synthase
MSTPSPLADAIIPPERAGQRLDQALAEVFPEYSRSRLQQWLKTERIHVDGQARRPRDRLVGGERISFRDTPDAGADPEAPHDLTLADAEPMGLAIVFEDADLLVVDKPAGLSVHPGAGQPAGTLLNGILHHAPGNARLPRNGLVHRIDKDTTGLLVIAKSEAAHTRLTEAIQAHHVQRSYRAFVNGPRIAGGRIDAPIGRHPVDRRRMAVRADGRPAVSHYRVQARYRRQTELAVHLETGRTHQIRVHLAHIGTPLVGDRRYGSQPTPPPQAHPELRQLLEHFPRQALHAERLSLTHPITGTPQTWEAPLPPDLLALQTHLRGDRDRADDRPTGRPR